MFGTNNVRNSAVLKSFETEGVYGGAVMVFTFTSSKIFIARSKVGRNGNYDGKLFSYLLL